MGYHGEWPDDIQKQVNSAQISFDESSAEDQERLKNYLTAWWFRRDIAEQMVAVAIMSGAPFPMVEKKTFYLATCLDCDPVLPMPFGSVMERLAWVAGHKNSTGHRVTLSQEAKLVAGP